MNSVEGTPPFSVDKDGTVIANLETVRSVGILEMSQVKNWQIVNAVGSTSHVVHFIGGGVLFYAYNDRDEIIELSAKGLNAHFGPENQVLFWAPL